MSRPSAAAVGILLVFAAGCARSSEGNKQLVRRLIDAMNARDFAAIDTLVATDVTRHSASTPGVTVTNRAQLKEFLRQDSTSVPDSRTDVHFMVAEDDLVAVYATYSGTQDGPLGPFPASHQHMEIPYIGILRVASDRIAEMWVEWDNVNLLTQLGHLAPPVADSEQQRQ